MRDNGETESRSRQRGWTKTGEAILYSRVNPEAHGKDNDVYTKQDERDLFLVYPD